MKKKNAFDVASDEFKRIREAKASTLTHTPTTTARCKCKVKEIDGLDQIVFCDFHVRVVNAHEELLMCLKEVVEDIPRINRLTFYRQAITRAEGR